MINLFTSVRSSKPFPALAIFFYLRPDMASLVDPPNRLYVY